MFGHRRVVDPEFRRAAAAHLVDGDERELRGRAETYGLTTEIDELFQYPRNRGERRVGTNADMD